MPDNVFTQPGQNPLLANATAWTNLEKAQLANQAQQMQFDAQKALGPIMQGAIDPQTGDVDYKKVILGVSANPDTAWMAPDLIDKAVARGLTQKESVLKELQINKEQQSALYDAASALLPKGAMLTQKDLLGAAADLYGAGVIDKEHYTNFAAQLPKDGGQLFGFAKQLAARAQGAAKTLDMTLGAITPHDTGSQVVFTQPNQLGQTVGVAGVLPKGLSPEKSAELVEVTGPRGEKYKLPYSQLYGSGAVAPAPGKPGEGGASSSPQAPVQTALPPAMQKAWDKFGQSFEGIQKQVETDGAIVQNLDEIESLMKGYHTGMGAEARLSLARALESAGVSKDKVDQVAGGDIDKGQALKSVLVDFATNRMRKLLEGGGRFTNIEFQAFQNSKPNLEMSEGAIKEALQHFRRGVLLDQKYAKGYDWHLRNAKSPTEFTNWWTDRMNEYESIRKKAREGK